MVVFAICHPRKSGDPRQIRHSYLNASIGSNFDALHAGQKRSPCP